MAQRYFFLHNEDQVETLDRLASEVRNGAATQPATLPWRSGSTGRVQEPRAQSVWCGEFQTPRVENLARL